MHKIGDDTPTSDVNGEWTEGGAGGTPSATVIKANWLNSVQRELLDVLSLFGITPSVSNDAQLREILRRMRQSSWFAPRQTDGAPTMAVTIGAGVIIASQPVERAQQTTGTIVAPSANPRIDRIVINRETATVSVVTGAENVTPVAPSVPAGSLAVARVNLSVGQSSIVNANITDERGIMSSVIPPPVATYIAGVAHYINDFGTVPSANLNLFANLIGDGNWYSVGPTGSTGRPQHLIWPALDNVPATAKALLVRYVATATGSAPITGVAQHIVRGRKYNMATAHSGQTNLNLTVPHTSGVAGTWGIKSDVILPLDDRRFELFYVAKNSVSGVTFANDLYLVGWLDALG